MIYDILIVPRHQGHYELPPVSLTYFDTTAKAYKTVTSEPLVLDVAQGAGPGTMTDFSGQQDLQELSRDIRYIKMKYASFSASWAGRFCGSPNCSITNSSERYLCEPSV